MLKNKNRIRVVKQRQDECFCYLCGTQLLNKFCPKCNKKVFIQNSTQFYLAKICGLLAHYDELFLISTDNHLGLAEEIADKTRFMGLIVRERKAIIIEEKDKSVPGVEIIIEKLPLLKEIREEGANG